jgi:Stress responsive A/B Barrel Domain
MIRHTVAFKLKHTKGSDPEAAFLKAAQVLTTIPAVRAFECLRQVGKKNHFDFGFSMEFASQPDFEAYNVHPEHVRFVETRWKPEVLDFIELDYIVFDPA